MNDQLFGVLISTVAYAFGMWLFRKTKLPFLNPLLIAIILIISVLLIFDIPYEKYNAGGQIISFFLAPATVVLAVPLYRQFELLKRHLIPILIGVIAGSATAVACVLGLSKLVGLDREMIISLLPKSITTPMGLSISESTGGNVSITMMAILITGVFRVVICPYILRWTHIKNSVAKGISIGTSAHALGTSKALEMGEVEGAMSGLAIGLAGITTVLIISVLVNFL
ncbi:MAG: LrgB family protein [Candidatus Azobacteroides sp.]|nr:LrgB family protein [Candidatus Azobacteroides sp.]